MSIMKRPELWMAPVVALALAAITLASITLASVEEADAAEPWPSAGSLAPAEVQAAHAAFLAGDFPAMASELKKGLAAAQAQGDSATQANLIALLEKAYEVRGAKGIPADWSLPEEIGWLRVTSKRKYNPYKDQVRYAVNAVGIQRQAGQIEQLQLVRYPSEVILDKQAGVGEWAEEKWDGGKTDGFWFGADEASNPPKEGLYLLNLKLKGKDPVQGWFVMSNMSSSDSPEIEAPQYGQALATGNPVMRWKDFRSPEFRPYERRRLSLHVFDVGANHQLVYDLGGVAPNLTESAIGLDPRGEGVKSLKKGSYRFSVVFDEERQFGDLCLGRASSTWVPFTVSH